LGLIFGHEREGIEDPVLGLADLVVEIPMYGFGNSLNVATADAVVGFEAVKN